MLSKSEFNYHFRLSKSEFNYHFPDMTMAMYIYIQREYDGKFSGWFTEMYEILRNNGFLDKVYAYIQRYYKIEKHTSYDRYSHEDAKVLHSRIEKQPFTNAIIIRLADTSYMVVSFTELAKIGEWD